MILATPEESAKSAAVSSSAERRVRNCANSCFKTLVDWELDGDVGDAHEGWGEAGVKAWGPFASRDSS